MLSILSTQDLSFGLIKKLLCDDFSNQINVKSALAVTFFEEKSTRTKKSFNIALDELNIKTINIDSESSSISKGEPLKQTLETISNYAEKIILIARTKNILENLNLKNLSIINAGDGSNQHPTQAIGDLFTIFQTLNCQFSENFLKNINIAIIGDIQKSRVARSNIELLTRFGASVTLVAPPHLMQKNVAEFYKKNNCCNLSRILTKEIIQENQFLMFLRTQTERHFDAIDIDLPSYALSEKLLEFLPQSSFIMHPGPVNVGKELCYDAYNHQNSLINAQAKNALTIRKNLILNIL